MIKINFKRANSFSANSENKFYLLDKKMNLAELENLYDGLAECLQAHKFSGEAGQACLLLKKTADKIQKFFFVGIGSLEKDSSLDAMDAYRNGLGEVVSLAKKHALSQLELDPCLNFFAEKNADELLQDICTTLQLAGYEFNTFKKDAKKDFSCTVSLLVSEKVNFDESKVLFEAKIIADAANFVRSIADMPPNVAHPEYVAQKAREVGNECPDLQINIFGQAKAEELGMEGFLAVGSGSKHEVKFVEIKYQAKNPTTRTIALVGKGVTFDSGGISLKPSHAMSGMKYDMCGAISVLGIMKAISQLKANVNVVGLMPLVENMPGGDCYRQDDIITHMNGLTSEVQNTDAEGRLILADAICYAEKFHSPEIIIDIATLTGACVVALGHFFTGMFTNHQPLADSLKKIGDKVGDYVWQLPCTEIYAQGITSNVADVANCGKSNFGGGAITAAMFLKKFVSKAKWVHLDIAGTEAELPVKSYLGKTATGVTVRLLTKFIQESF